MSDKCQCLFWLSFISTLYICFRPLLGQLLVGACLPQTLLRSECDILGIYLLLASVLSFPFFLRDKPKQRCVEPRQRNDEPRHNHTTAIELSFPLMKLISEAIYNRAEAA